MGSLTQVVNGEYIGADKYVIEDAGDGKSTVVFSPDNVLKEGTPVGAELLNEIQKNGLYYLAGTHRVDGQESIYDCTLIGIDTFDFTQLNVLFKPDTKPTQSTIKLNISGEVYTLSGLLQSSNQIGLVLIKSELIAYTWGTKMELVNNFTGGEEKALSGEMGTNLMGAKQDGSFPLRVAEVGKNYRAGNGKLYKCITAYNGTEISLPNANFTELSILENSNRLDNLFEIIYERPNLAFVRYGNIVVGNGGVSELIRDFPNYQLTFDSKFLPTTPVYCSMQSDNSNTVGELVIYKNGSYKLSNPHGSFNITWFIKI